MAVGECGRGAGVIRDSLGWPPAHVQSVAQVMSMAGMFKATAGGTSSSRVVTVGVGVVAGYGLMLNQYSAAVLGAAMGGMLADWIYGAYRPAPVTAP